MQILQCVTYRCPNQDYLLNRQSPCSLDTFLEIFPFDKVHHKILSLFG